MLTLSLGCGKVHINSPYPQAIWINWPAHHHFARKIDSNNHWLSLFRGVIWIPVIPIQLYPSSIYPCSLTVPYRISKHLFISFVTINFLFYCSNWFSLVTIAYSLIDCKVALFACHFWWALKFFWHTFLSVSAVVEQGGCLIDWLIGLNCYWDWRTVDIIFLPFFIIIIHSILLSWSSEDT